ncbi:MAG: sugar ABC transporter ATP-binding protein [Spirochaetaceae bacterium]|jgi:monosaccharide-transporting ATPase|nr:sugar ABC transporter ATP-binding protein [Spirochaetaceae bacterium]
MESGALLKMQNIYKEFPGVLALQNVHFELKSGEIHALLGENGAGKSTLIKVLTGAESLTSGQVDLNGKRLRIKSPLQAQNEGISTVYQEVNLCPNLSVAENIYIGREPRNRAGLINWKEMKSRSNLLLKDFDLQIDVEKTLDNYSVAVQQMVAIARSCDIQAKVLILDEPTSSLTDTEVKKLFSVMKRLRKEGMGIIFVTHFLDQVYEVCDRITVLRNGEYICTEKISKMNHMELVSKMIGKEYSELSDKLRSFSEKSENKETLVSLDQVYSAGKMRPFDLDIRKGEILGFAGLLGSGRSEMARVIFGADSADGGSMKINGREVKICTPLEGIQAGIAFCPEDRKIEGIVGELTIRENIILALQTKKGMTKPISINDAKAIANKYIKLLNIKTPGQDQIMRNLSGGNQQKVILARWMATKPELLILDEPTRGIDVGTKAEIQKIMIELSESGMSVIFISSEIDEMMRCCSRMAVLKDRVKICELNGDELTESQVMKSIAGGMN